MILPSSYIPYIFFSAGLTCALRPRRPVAPPSSSYLGSRTPLLRTDVFLFSHTRSLFLSLLFLPSLAHSVRGAKVLCEEEGNELLFFLGEWILPDLEWHWPNNEIGLKYYDNLAITDQHKCLLSSSRKKWANSSPPDFLPPPRTRGREGGGKPDLGRKALSPLRPSLSHSLWLWAISCLLNSCSHPSLRSLPREEEHNSTGLESGRRRDGRLCIIVACEALPPHPPPLHGPPFAFIMGEGGGEQGRLQLLRDMLRGKRKSFFSTLSHSCILLEKGKRATGVFSSRRKSNRAASLSRSQFPCGGHGKACCTT